MYRKILNSRNISLSLCASLLWTAHAHSLNPDSESPKSKFTKTFIWGNGRYQAKPDSFIQFKNFEPKIIETFLGEKLKKIESKTLKFSR